MSEKAEIDGYTAWMNVHLAAADCQAGDVLLDLLKGHRLRALLQSKLLVLFRTHTLSIDLFAGVTGSAPKRIDSLDGYDSSLTLCVCIFYLCQADSQPEGDAC